MTTTTLVLNLGVSRPSPTAQLLSTSTTLTCDPQYSSTLRTGPTRTFKNVPVDAGATLLLRVEVPTIEKVAGGPAFDLVVQQEFKVETDLSLTPTRSGFDKLIDWHPLHPRIVVGNGKPPYRLSIDLLFVDVSLCMKKKGKLASYLDPAYLVEGRNEFVFPPNTVDGKKSLIHHGCQVRIFQMTMGRPACWSIVVPPNLPEDASGYNVLVFYQPTLIGAEYKSAADCQFHHDENLPRYTRDPPVWAPYYWARRVDGSFYRVSWPHTGFEGQIAASRKPVILMMPYPHGENMDFGDAITRQLPMLVESLLRALWGAALIGLDQKQPIALKRLGLSGFSAGGGAATAAWSALRKVESRLKELYLFDPAGAPAGSDIAEWLKADSDRRACFIGGQYYQKMATLADAIKAKGASALLLPPSADYYSARGTPWGASQSLLDKNLNPDMGTLTTPGESEQPLSKSSRVSLSKLSPLTLRADAIAVERTMDATRIDAAGVVRAWQVGQNQHKPGEQAVVTAKDFDALLYKHGEVLDMRHQWSVGGGFGNPARYPYGDADPAKVGGETFLGHLHACLRGSGFK